MLKRSLKNNEVCAQLFYDLEAQSQKSLSVYIDKCASDTRVPTRLYRGCAQARLSGCLHLSISGLHGLSPLNTTGCAAGRWLASSLKPMGEDKVEENLF